MTMKIDAIAFDADDTLWHNEDHFAATEDAFADLMEPWATHDEARAELLAMETQNLELFGYGVKAFTLSMIEAAMMISRGAISAADLGMLIERGKDMLARPAELLPGITDVLDELSRSHRLLMITKGDLHHQERKVKGSGLAHFFEAVEVVSEKDISTYSDVIAKNGVDPAGFVMVGNSVKSDILPVLALGGVGVHIPYAFTWAHEHADSTVHGENEPGSRLWRLDTVKELPTLVRSLQS